MIRRLGEYFEGQKVKGNIIHDDGTCEEIDAVVTRFPAQRYTDLVVQDINTLELKELAIADVLNFGWDWESNPEFQKLRELLVLSAFTHTQAIMLAGEILSAGDDLEQNAADALSEAHAAVREGSIETKSARQLAEHLHPENENTNGMITYAEYKRPR